MVEFAGYAAFRAASNMNSLVLFGILFGGVGGFTLQRNGNEFHRILVKIPC